MDLKIEYLNDLEKLVEQNEEPGETPAVMELKSNFIEENEIKNIDLKKLPSVYYKYTKYAIFYNTINSNNKDRIKNLMSTLRENDTILEKLQLLSRFEGVNNSFDLEDILTDIVKISINEYYYEKLDFKRKSKLENFVKEINKSLKSYGFKLLLKELKKFEMYYQQHDNFISYFYNDNIYANSFFGIEKPSDYYNLYKLTSNSISKKANNKFSDTFVFYSEYQFKRGLFKDDNSKNLPLHFIMLDLFRKNCRFTCVKSNISDLLNLFNSVYRKSVRDNNVDFIKEKIQNYITEFYVFNDNTIDILFDEKYKYYYFKDNKFVEENDIQYEKAKSSNILKSLLYI
ncbi:hypothetical protein JK211_14495 [Tatumella sp. JGM130]|uniref:hypothetical protein n=1 Tax=Tatumella sp. JGM130 TaxID=2799797 RepID=UPI001BAEAE7B|nr:hypothetical protein [Tatumella sp. JGM130]MBS0895224.1 hypothetical protein [Tatumella sp. JGM130]